MTDETTLKMRQTVPPSLSRHQYGSLRFIAKNNVTMEYLRNAHANTLGSLAYRGYLKLSGVGIGDKAVVILTQSGAEALLYYERATMNERTHEGELTDRCLRLLKHSRRVAILTKTA